MEKFRKLFQQKLLDIEFWFWIQHSVGKRRSKFKSNEMENLWNLIFSRNLFQQIMIHKVNTIRPLFLFGLAPSFISNSTTSGSPDDAP